MSLDLIDPVYRNANYYAAPAGADRAYTLFQHALGASGRVAIGSFVMRDREHVCMVQSYYVGLLITTLFYEYEIRSAENIRELQRKEPAISSHELKLAQQLIDQRTVKKFAIGKFKDTFAQQLKVLIKQKQAGKKIRLPKEKKGGSMSKKATLADMLQASIKAR